MDAVEYVKVMKADPGDLIQWMKTKATHNVWKKKVQELEDKVCLLILKIIFI